MYSRVTETKQWFWNILPSVKDVHLLFKHNVSYLVTFLCVWEQVS